MPEHTPTIISNSSPTEPPHALREAVGVFHDVESFEAAIDELMRSGFHRSDISLLANDKDVENKLGHKYRRTTELEDDADAPRASYIDEESIVEGKSVIVNGLAYVGAIGTVALIISSGGSLAWAIAGGYIANRLGKRHTDRLQSQLDKGGLLLWVHLRDDDYAQRAEDILRMRSSDDVHIHDIPIDHVSEGNPLHGINIDPFLPKAPI